MTIELLSHASGIEEKKLERVRSLLHSFLFHRVFYEMKDAIQHYLAFSFIPLLAILGFFVMVPLLLRTTALTTTMRACYLGLTLTVLLLWLYLCGSDPGQVVDKHGHLQKIGVTNVDLHKRYEMIMSGEQFMQNAVCATCEIERPDRCKHCTKCGVSVMRLDHHCTG